MVTQRGRLAVPVFDSRETQVRVVPESRADPVWVLNRSKSMGGVDCYIRNSSGSARVCDGANPVRSISYCRSQAKRILNLGYPPVGIVIHSIDVGEAIAHLYHLASIVEDDLSRV